MYKLWNDENGGIISVEYILVMTIIVGGITFGAYSLRDAINYEFADISRGFSSLDQSFYVAPISSRSAWAAGSNYLDVDKPTEVNVDAPKCIEVLY